MVEWSGDVRGRLAPRGCSSAWRACRVLGAVAILTWAGRPAHAARAGEVSVGGEHVLTIRCPAGGMTVQQRADEVMARLRVILSDPNLAPGDVRVQPLGRNEAAIVVKGHLLVTMDRQTAQASGYTPMALAEQWAESLRRVLPQINVKPNPDLDRPAGVR